MNNETTKYEHLLEYDDVLMNNVPHIQTGNSILDDSNLPPAYSQLPRKRSTLPEECATSSRRNREAALSDLATYIKTTFGYTLTPEDQTRCINAPETASKTILEQLARELAEKERLAGKENVNSFIRYQYLQAIDRKWLDHLENLESLREAVYLRSYGQKNPLTEYKLEGFDIFYSMLDDIRIEIASRVFLVKVQSPEEAGQVRRAKTVSADAHHRAVGAFRSLPVSGPLSASKPDSTQVIQVVPKVGRNEPCPCGSGKNTSIVADDKTRKNEITGAYGGNTVTI